MTNEPLAIQMRPTKLLEVVGQHHLLDEGKIIYNLVKNKRLVSMVLYGAPGCGKTTLAHVLVNEMCVNAIDLNATINNKKDFEEAIDKAKSTGDILLIDEIHRMNKDKQDILLPHLESGKITVIGMTSENPYHKLNPAVRSRMQLFKLMPLTIDEVKEDVIRLLKSKIYSNLEIDNDALDRIANFSNGDLRYVYNLIEVAYFATVNGHITIDILNEINSTANVQMDGSDDGYYDTISALQKSIRGSDINAALHYTAKLIAADQVDILLRRLSVIAYEDIGLANPAIGPRLDAAINAYERLGLPEGRIPLGEIVCEMALSPKSNTSHVALDEALKDIEEGKTGPVPLHIRTNSYSYKYPHDNPQAVVKQQYLPDKLLGREYYKPKSIGGEKQYKETYENLKRFFNS